ncbi:hypothetical protein BCR33DRAFT_813034 [Rhizoclosmatium globosum]|uniref:Uncharacterized protein n=1 Tax=Rhizoclosmatium globosum TaxID=329046 RepID=A0A1Y2CGU8_9FUNG|nr:hypothetical protein BCR33DRAFT_813034 [Rhizoclosmatium globosum]|eukprot:ORY46137.1 hypothetical protein BCR33DRAFT_813034 [Rhizoclosmatium globosum]
MAPQKPIFGPPTVYNYTGGAFERVFINQFDCQGIPQPADLKCLDFSLTNFNSTQPYFNYAAIKDHFVWKDTTSCSGDFAQRFNATYGHPILDFSVNGAFDSTRFVRRVNFAVTASTGTSVPSPERRAPASTYCSLSYASSTTQFTDAPYLLAENQPVCGAKAPLVNATAYPPYSFAVVTPYLAKDGTFGFTFNYSPDDDKNLELADLAAAYSVNASSIVYKFISATKFSVTVPAIPDDLSADSSCVYTYKARTASETKGRVYSLNKITQGTIPLKENATLTDGCITSLFDAKYGEFSFTTTANDTCGQTDYASRFGRYFDLETYYLSMYVLSTGEITFNVSDTYKDGNYDRNNRRRDGIADYSFNFVDKAAFATTATTATTVSTSASASGSAAASATVVVTTTASAVPTAYVAPANPTAYVAPAVPAYGAPANNNNNLYKGAAVEKVGIVAALVAAFVLV